MHPYITSDELIIYGPKIIKNHHIWVLGHLGLEMCFAWGIIQWSTPSRLYQEFQTTLAAYSEIRCSPNLGYEYTKLSPGGQLI